MDRGREFDAAHPRRFEERARSLRPDMLATLIYTSGTTGQPKGVELVHDCWVKQAAAIDASGVLDHRPALQYFWLPLAHSFGKMIGTAQLRIGFPTAIDGRLEKIVENLGVVKPTFVCAVPRIFEKVHNRVLQNAREGGTAKQAIFRWAVSVGRQHPRLTRAGKRPGVLLAAQRLVADRLVFSKVRTLFGGRLKFYIITEDIWNCAQCFSCVRCPRQNTPGGLVTILREVSLKNGLQESKDALQGYSRVIYKVMLKGNQVSPDMLQPDFFPDWGPWVQGFTQNIHVGRKAIPMDSIRGLTDVAWRTDRKTLLELYTIWFESGNMDIIKELDESLYDLLTDVMNEELEEG